MIHFYCTENVRNYKNDSLYRTFTKGVVFYSWLPNFVHSIPMPLIFLSCHFLFYISFHSIGVLLYHSYYANMIWCFTILNISAYNGACYYMDYFSKRYNAQINKLDQLECEILDTPTLKK